MTSPNEPVWADNPPYSGSAADLSGTSTTDIAKQQASQVAQSASGAVQQVTGTAKDQAAVVASDAKEHARNLVGETRDQVSQQAATQRDKAVTNLRSMGDQLHTMAQSGDSSGVAGTLARQAGDTTHKFAGYLEGREPSDLVDDSGIPPASRASPTSTPRCRLCMSPGRYGAQGWCSAHAVTGGPGMG